MPSKIEIQPPFRKIATLRCSFALGDFVLLSTLPAAADATLERVAIVERHGVRPPTKPVSTLAAYPKAECALEAFAQSFERTIGSSAGR